MIRVAELFSKNHTVFIYGQEKYKNNKQFCENLEKCIENSDIIISGIPLSRDSVYVNAPYSDKEIRLDEIYTNIENKIFIAGGIPIQFYENKTIKNIDLLQSEELTILNAIPTVEGTIKIAIEETEITIHESKVMVFGYGRIGKILCKNFKNLGAKVYCVARKEADLAWIREEGCIPIRYNEIEKEADKMDIIINTVPSLVIQERTIKNLKKSCLIIDVASNPGGVDKNIAKRYKINVITAPRNSWKNCTINSSKIHKRSYRKPIIKIEKYIKNKFN